jgi:hypothetical protein
MCPRIAFDRARTPKVRSPRRHGLVPPYGGRACRENRVNIFCVLRAGHPYFFRELRSPVSGETIRGRKPQVDIRESCCRFRCWSGRESAWLVSKVIPAMGGTPGPAPKSMQLSRSSLLSSYLQRFNAKRRIHYKIDVQPRWRSDTPSPRLKEPVKIPSRAAR